MADGIREVAKLPDPLGEMPKMWTRPNGMQVGRVRVPIGVIGIIYESRPNVTADSAALCLKSGNACVLRGGSEAIQVEQRHRRRSLRGGGEMRRFRPVRSRLWTDRTANWCRCS